MAWATRQHSKGRIDRAGAILIQRDPPDLDAALVIISNWRACHSYPLQVVKMTLRGRAYKISSKALIAQRLKRLPSIALKLTHNPDMKLSQMQDIGGCRAIMPSLKDAQKLIRRYEISRAKNPRHGRPTQIEAYDYISTPKPDGYRSYHLVYKYQSKELRKKIFEGQRIEIQIRSQLQHLWATAVETVQTFTGQALKSKIKSGDPRWLRFFALMGSTIALKEKCPPVPDTPEDRQQLKSELRDLAQVLRVQDVLGGFAFGMDQLAAEESLQGASIYLLVLDSDKKQLTTTSFMADEMPKASEEYLKIERETENKPQIQAVLVSVESVDALRAAYPNYYLDTSAFIREMRRAIQ
jgi:hypothetical protein